MKGADSIVACASHVAIGDKQPALPRTFSCMFRMLSIKTIAASLGSLAVALAIGGGLAPAAQYWLCLGAALFAFMSLAVLFAGHLWTIQQSLARLPNDIARTLPAELHAMQVILRRFPECSIPTSEWSMRFSNLLALLDVLDRRKPEFVVELGSGISTLLVAAWMREHSRGKVVSFDHDPEWADVTRRYLWQEGLADFANVVNAPLISVRSLGVTCDWYGVSAQLSKVASVDLLIVDGPPAGTEDKCLARLPALEQLHAKLSPSCAIVLDDALRPGEQEVVALWMKQFSEFDLRTIRSSTGMAILSRDGFDASASNEPTASQKVAPFQASANY